MLTGNKVGFAAIKILISSEDQIADSEDHLAVLLNLYLGSPAGLACTAHERIELRNLLRCQHMSNTFVGLKLPHMPLFHFSPTLWPKLMFLRGLTGFASIPPGNRLDDVPEAWYKPARKLQATTPTSVELTLTISESDFMKHVTAGAVFKSGGAPPPALSGPCVELQRTSWGLHFGTPADAFQLYVKPTCTDPRPIGSVASEKVGVHVEITYRMHSTSAAVALTCSKCWVGPGGMGPSNFVQTHGKRRGDPTDFAWWKDYIIGGHLRFSATVKLL